MNIFNGLFKSGSVTNLNESSCIGNYYRRLITDYQRIFYVISIELWNLLSH